ncbi:glutamate 5-kinase [Neiella marina]|uniref:Glutamate 5-kinase n=2 Tax=Neiella holothuriorum TaxID=2870530 RepID=A0ABS7EBP9_9GAMM|nr:glutamate 5-kinase [Neiella holothuriorum]MBW8189629.1 glutamate 5-kinase [Neiella holothuriorum]
MNKPSDYRRIVVKLGTSVLTGGGNRLDKAHMVELVRQLAVLHRQGCDIIVCTSGAIAAGREHLGFPELADTVASKQLLAAVGQSQLIQVWEQLFQLYGIHVGQMLLTRADVEDRERFLNARDTINALLAQRIVPLVNENDAVATQEIKVGDNDNLSALVSVLAEADLLMLLTDQPGLFNADPRSNPDAELIAEVEHIDDTLRQLAGDSVSGLGTGGMATKLQAADVARHGGVDVVIAAGHQPEVITNLWQGQRVGTRFSATANLSASRKRWILAGLAPDGDVIIDSGAIRALRERGSSLLPKGILRVNGSFDRGDTVRVLTEEGVIVARGISRYSASDLDKIKRQHSDQIIPLLGYEYGSVAIHRNELIVV